MIWYPHCLQEDLAEFEEKLEAVRAERLAKRRDERRQRRKAEAAAAKQAEEERLSKC